MKIAINRCSGGFRLSTEAYEWLIENKGWRVTEFNEDGSGYKDSTAQIVKGDRKSYFLCEDKDDSKFRVNPDLIECIEALGSKVNSSVSKIEVIEIPDDIEFTIERFHGTEWIAEKHRTWP